MGNAVDPAGGGGVDRRAFAGQHLEADAASSQVVHSVDQTAQVAPEAIQFLYDQRIARSQGLQAACQTRPILAFTRSLIFVEMRWIDASRNQRIALQIGGLGAVRLRYPHVAD